MKEAGEAPISWEQHLSPGSLISENFEFLSEKIGTLVSRLIEKAVVEPLRSGRKTKNPEALAGSPSAASLGRLKAAKRRFCRSSVHLGPRI
jgi:hypothetical protein